MPSFFSKFGGAAKAAQLKARERSYQALPSTEFAFRLFEELKPCDRNLAICPYSARIVLAMLWQGATGETRREMTDILRLNEHPEARGNHYERLGKPLVFNWRQSAAAWKCSLRTLYGAMKDSRQKKLTQRH